MPKFNGIFYKELLIKGAFIYKPKPYLDRRGNFHEAFNITDFLTICDRIPGCGDGMINFRIDQVNVSTSKNNVLRGMHLQSRKSQLTKIVGCRHGAIIDVIVDLRPSSTTYRKWLPVFLSGSLPSTYVVIPTGCAHGFYTAEDNTEVIYYQYGLYNKAEEITLKWDDPDIGVNWGGINPIVSPKDEDGLSFQEIEAKGVV